MSVIRNIKVNAGKPYNVTVGKGLLPRVGSLLSQTVSPCHAAVITDSNVAPLYLAQTEESLRSAGYKVCSYVFPAGEKNKNLVTLSGILEFLAENRLTRQDCVFALGGGVTGDMAGFAAGCYLRGIRFVQLPTTLLAAVDSSVGGKTAVDLKAGKNLAGMFIQPSAVFCDTDCLSTLSDSLFSDGLAEAIKTGVLFDAELFAMCDNARENADISELIARCVQLKADIVKTDEFEKGPRKLLNLGHTPAHAIEKLSGYRISHGCAVATGTVMMARAAERLGFCTRPCAAEIGLMMLSNGLPITTNFTPEKLAEAALGDKKRSGDEITLVLPEEIGRCTLEKFPVSELCEVFRAGMEG